jgi:HlyD family secretion protein
MFATIKKYAKKPWVIAVAIIVVLVLIIFIKGRSGKTQDEIVKAERTTVREEVSVTGKVTPFQKSDLGFEKGGTVSSINAKVGDRVKKGTVIAALDDRQTYASLLGAQASLSAAQADLADNLSNTDIEYTNAKKNAINAAREAYVKVQNVLINQADTFFMNGTSINPTLTISAESVSAGKVVESKRYQAGAALEKWRIRLDSPTASEDAPLLLSDVHGYLIPIKDFMDSLSFTVLTLVRNNANLSQTTLDTYTSTMNSANANFNTALSSITTAENTLNSNAPKSTKSLQARVDQARANVVSYQAQYAKSLIVAPFDGVVTVIDPQLGDIVGGNQTEVTIISDQGFKVEANIAEADIAKIKVGQRATITLDAYGSETVFDATVSNIDPAETIIDGVPTYKTTFAFTASDDRIKSGMTANIDVEGQAHENVLAIPQRAITTKSGGKFVTIKSGDVTKEVQVTTGLRGFDGKVEVMSGLTEGDSVVISQTK